MILGSCYRPPVITFSRFYFCCRNAVCYAERFASGTEPPVYCRALAAYLRVVTSDKYGLVLADHDACKAGAVGKRTIPDTGYAIGNYNAGQPGAVGKRTIPDTGYAIGNYNACQPGAVAKRIIPYTGYAVRDMHTGQAGADVKRTIPDTGNTVGNVAMPVFDEGFQVHAIALRRSIVFTAYRA